MEPTFLLAAVGSLILSVSVHECAHAAVAWRAGDPTARDMGRVTLNPLAHVDPFWSLLLPALFYATAGVAIGAGKPVPINPMQLTRTGYAAAVAAGPLSNLALAIAGGLLLRVSGATAPGMGFAETVLRDFVLMNLGLLVLNFLPLPPLDGSGVVAALFFRQPGLGGPAFVTSGLLLMALLAVGALDAVLGPLLNAFIRVFSAVGLW